MGSERVKFGYHQVTANAADNLTTSLLGAQANPWRKKVTLMAKKSNTTDNVTDVQVSPASGGAGVTGPIVMAPGDIWTIESAVGCEFSLSDWYVKVGTDGDGLIVMHH